MDKYGLSDIDRLEHISNSISLIFNFCEGKSESEFIADQMLSSSVLYQFIIIGEAFRYVDPGLLEKYQYPFSWPPVTGQTRLFLSSSMLRIRPGSLLQCLCMIKM
jgi:hypothetical protein